MKINKILAAGVAATLAVSSLSAVVSAEKVTKSFDIFTTYAGYNGISLKIDADVNRDIADNLVQDDVQKLVFKDLEANVTAKYLRQVDFDITKNKGIRITATGYQEANSSSTVTKTFKLLKGTTDTTAVDYDATAAGKWYIIVLDKETPVYHDGEFASFFFHRITSLTFEIDLKAGDTNLEARYNEWSNGNTVYDLDIGDIQIGTRYQPTATTYAWDYATTEAAAKADFNGLKVAYQHNYTYGTNNTNNATDKNEVLSEAAQKVSTQIDNIVTKGAPLVINASLEATPVPKTAEVYTIIDAGAGTFAAAGAAADITVAAADTLRTEAKATKVKVGNAILDLYKVTAANAAAEVAVDDYVSKAFTAEPTAAVDGVKGYAAAANAETIVKVDLSNYITATTAVINQSNPYDPATDDIAAGTYVLATVAYDGTISYSVMTDKLIGEAAKGVIAVTTLGEGDSTAHLLSYAFANGGWYESKTQYGDQLGNDNTAGTVTYQNQYKSSTGVYTYQRNGWLPKTTLQSTAAIKNKIERADVWLLSYTGDNNSDGKGYNPWAPDVQDDNQSYNATFWDGTAPNGFAGLASQVADFFNKQNNGKITFTFAAAATAGTTKWSDGVPSTEVGLKGFTSEYLKDFALFFNYDNTTGTMLTAEKLDTKAGTMTFDISDYLSDCGGLTKATLHDIYYGLDNGIKDETAWSGKYGLWVSKIDLEYDDAAAAAADAASDDVAADDTAADVDVDADDDDDDTAAVVDEDDDDDDDDAAIIADDDDDDDDDDTAAVISDDDEDDSATAADVDVVTPAGNDTNPATGVGLAVIPAIVAAAAMAISKKRK